MAIFSWPARPWPGRKTWPLALAHGDSAPPQAHAAASDATIRRFELFVHQYERQILNFCWRMVGDEQLARDLTQETFLRAWQHFDRVSDYEQPRAWLFHVATNITLTVRQRRSTPIGRARSLDGLDDPAGSDPANRIIEHALVHETLQSLTPRYRAALILREVYGLDADEGAQALGISRDAFKMTVSRAREQFRQHYRAQEDGQ